jgi:putative membrane protein
MTLEPNGGGKPRDRGAITFGILGGFLAWFLHLLVSFWLVPFICDPERIWILHLVTIAMGLIAAAATGVAWRTHRRLAGVPSPDRTSEFLALFGMLLSGFFLFLILFEGLPALIQADPCGPLPTLDRPVIRGPDGEGLVLAMLFHPDGLIGPGSAWSAWNLDLGLLSVLYLLAGLYATGVRRVWKRAGRGRGIPVWRVWCYFGAVTALLLALVSPIDALGGALFSVHMVQHMLLMVVAAPLLVLGRPMLGYVWALPERHRHRVSAWWHRFRPARMSWAVVSHPAVILVVHIGALWVWHLPELYQAALEAAWVHHLEHASFFFTALLFWWAVTESGARGRWPGYGAGVLYVFATALQSGALGALMLFAREPWYPAHQEGADLWGVELLTDQQVAGAIMWIPAGLVYAGAALVLFLAWVRQSDEAVLRAGAFHPEQG